MKKIVLLTSVLLAVCMLFACGGEKEKSSEPLVVTKWDDNVMTAVTYSDSSRKEIIEFERRIYYESWDLKRSEIYRFEHEYKYSFVFHIYKNHRWIRTVNGMFEPFDPENTDISGLPLDYQSVVDYSWPDDGFSTTTYDLQEGRYSSEFSSKDYPGKTEYYERGIITVTDLDALRNGNTFCDKIPEYNAYYFKNGKTKSDCFFEDGRTQVTEYDEKGNMLSQKQTVPNSTGTLITESVIRNGKSTETKKTQLDFNGDKIRETVFTYYESGYTKRESVQKYDSSMHYSIKEYYDKKANCCSFVEEGSVYCLTQYEYDENGKLTAGRGFGINGELLIESTDEGKIRGYMLNYLRLLPEYEPPAAPYDLTLKDDCALAFRNDSDASEYEICITFEPAGGSPVELGISVSYVAVRQENGYYVCDLRNQISEGYGYLVHIGEIPEGVPVIISCSMKAITADGDYSYASENSNTTEFRPDLSD